MYRVLYRKWRPKTFDDVVGQPQVTKTLQNEIKLGRINHAYLFTGSRGTGKTSCAKIFAKAVNCLDPENGNPCGKCKNCLGIEQGEILDVVEMDAASNRGIDDIREIIEKARFAPAKGKYRVYIVDEVHMLTDQAFNALLKILEEPPEHVIFILATTEVHKLPATIISRCQRFDFHRISADAIAHRLKFVAQQEEVALTDDGALLISAVSDGALRDALSLLDRCIALSKNINSEIVQKAAGLAKKDYLYELASCCINKNSAKAMEIVDGLYADSKDMARLCEELTDHFRNLMLIKTVKNPRRYMVMSDDDFDTAQTQADYLAVEEIVYIMDVLQQSCGRMGRVSSNRTELETALIKLTAPEMDFSLDALLSRLSALERAVKKAGRITNDNSYNEKTTETNDNAPLMGNKDSVAGKEISENRQSTQNTQSLESKQSLSNNDTAENRQSLDNTESVENTDNTDNIKNNGNDVQLSPQDEKSDSAATDSSYRESRIDRELNPAKHRAYSEDDDRSEQGQHLQNSQEQGQQSPSSREQGRQTQNYQAQNPQAQNPQAQNPQAQNPQAQNPQEQNLPGQAVPKQNSAVDREELVRSAKPFLQWPEVVEHMASCAKSIAMHFVDTSAYESGNYLLIDADSPTPFEMLKNSETREAVRESIAEITGKKYSLGPYRKLENQQEVKTDPLDDFVKNLEENGINITEE